MRECLMIRQMDWEIRSHFGGWITKRNYSPTVSSKRIFCIYDNERDGGRGHRMCVDLLGKSTWLDSTRIERVWGMGMNLDSIKSGHISCKETFR